LLERPEDEHLTAEEIAGVLDLGSCEAMRAERQDHARTCDVCERTIAMHQEQEGRLRRLAVGARAEAGGPRKEPGPECPEAAVWASLAAGLTDPARKDTLLAHASQCDACGALLRELAQDFSEMSETELQDLEKLESARPDWQRSMARRMALESGGAPAKPRFPPWLLRAAAVLVALGGGWWGYEHWVLSDPARLIAQAYTRQRPFDLRIAGAGHGPVRIERGAGSAFHRPPSLLEAEARIARELEKDRDSAKWLELRARAEMLGWDAETAIATLQHALDQKPDDPALLADLGMAYALRAETADRNVDYGYAIEYLSRSLKAKPNSPEATFNRAVVYERLYVYEEAIREWRHYLDLDKAGPWRDEAQRRLAELELKKKSGKTP
jgi:tetratricopeptide (TPR) repeat protein